MFEKGYPLKFKLAATYCIKCDTSDCYKLMTRKKTQGLVHVGILGRH